jgi:molybdate/tungstate transport system substrate-binding protein
LSWAKQVKKFDLQMGGLLVKKIMIMMITLLMVALLAGSACAADLNFKVGDSSYIPYPDPVIQNGTTLVPISLITDTLDIDAKVSEKAGTVLLVKNDNEVLIDATKLEIKINGQAVIAQKPPQVINNHIYIPMKQVAEALGAVVNWENTTRTINITPAEDKNTLIIFHAGSLKAPMADLKAAFLKTHPRARIYFESAGSLDCARKVTEQGRQADLIASADYAVFDQLMIPKYTDWYAMFAKNEMVLCYTDKSKSAAEIKDDNWYSILTGSGVSYTHTNPDLDPAGYRALLVWQLAEEHYKAAGLYDKLVAGCPAEKVYNSAADLITALKDGKVDYAFEYLSVAQQNGFKYIALPEQINLSSVKYADFYKTAKVTTAGATAGTTVEQTGQPIINAITVPNNAPNRALAMEFAKLMLSEEGNAIMTKAFQTPIVPTQFNDAAKIPSELK